MDFRQASHEDYCGIDGVIHDNVKLTIESMSDCQQHESLRGGIVARRSLPFLEQRSSVASSAFCQHAPIRHIVGIVAIVAEQ